MLDGREMTIVKVGEKGPVVNAEDDELVAGITEEAGGAAGNTSDVVDDVIDS